MVPVMPKDRAHAAVALLQRDASAEHTGVFEWCHVGEQQIVIALRRITTAGHEHDRRGQ
jgi:hypothetical protein